MKNTIQFYQINERTVKAVAVVFGKKVTAKAKCNPIDTFDFATGCEIAGLRLKIKASHIKDAMMYKQMEVIEEKLAKLYKERLKLVQAMDRNVMQKEEFLEELMETLDEGYEW